MKQQIGIGTVWSILASLPKLLHPDYQHLDIRCIEFDGEMYTIRTFSKKCMNLKTIHGRLGSHNSNHVYFHVKPSGIQQLCYCTCPDKTCKDYISKSVSIRTKLSPEYYMTLFPDKNLQLVSVTFKLSTTEQRVKQKERVKAIVAAKRHAEAFSY